MQSVLLIDDDADLLEMVELVLKSSSWHVNSLTSGRDLLSHVEEKKPSVIIMDIYLGENDGRDLCKLLKDSSQYSHIPVLLYSAGVITPESIRESRADHFIAKPFQIDNFIATVKKLADKETV